VFLDDVIARGALLPLVGKGLRIPEDVQVISFSCYGMGPLYFDPLTRIEANSVTDTELIVTYLMRILRSGMKPAEELLLEPDFIIGNSTRPR